MNIGEVSERSGLPPKTIRYYEDINLVRPLRSDNGYRSFRESDIHKLAFLGRARALAQRQCLGGRGGAAALLGGGGDEGATIRWVKQPPEDCETSWTAGMVVADAQGGLSPHPGSAVHVYVRAE